MRPLLNGGTLRGPMVGPKRSRWVVAVVLTLVGAAVGAMWRHPNQLVFISQLACAALSVLGMVLNPPLRSAHGALAFVFGSVAVSTLLRQGPAKTALLVSACAAVLIAGFLLVRFRALVARGVRP
jgi:hypothetical protein